MRFTGRSIGNAFLQLVSIVLLLLFGYFSGITKPAVYFALAAAAALFLIGWFRPAYQALAFSIGCVAAYGGYVMYRLWAAGPNEPATWDDLIWLIVFPSFALLGGINREAARPPEDDPFSMLRARSLETLEDEDAFRLDERLDFLSGTAFLYRLEEEVLSGLRERKKFLVLLIKLENLREFARIFGVDQARILLTTLAEWLHEFPVAAKAQVGESVLAVILPTGDRSELESVEDQLEAKFHDLRMSRPRRESNIRLKLRFGAAECPADGIEAKTLMEKAKDELEWSAT